jgi:hypothetical protein
MGMTINPPGDFFTGDNYPIKYKYRAAGTSIRARRPQLKRQSSWLMPAGPLQKMITFVAVFTGKFLATFLLNPPKVSPVKDLRRF